MTMTTTEANLSTITNETEHPHLVCDGGQICFRGGHCHSYFHDAHVCFDGDACFRGGDDLVCLRDGHAAYFRDGGSYHAGLLDGGHDGRYACLHACCAHGILHSH